jgi:hypothetical protein
MASKDLTYLSTEGPFNVYERRKQKEPIDDLKEFKKSMIKALEGYDTRQKKPVRWNFLKDNEGLFMLSQSLDPFYKVVDVVNKARTGKSIYDPINKKIKERDYIDGFAEIAKGIDSGAYKLSVSIGELLFAGTDYLTNANFAEDFRKKSEKWKPDEPETWRGDLASLAVQYGLPGIGTAKLVHRLSKMAPLIKVMAKMNNSKASKLAHRLSPKLAAGTTKVSKRMIEQGLIGAGTFALGTPSDDRGLWTKPEDTSGLSGRKKAAAIFRNKIRHGQEGAIVGGLFPLAGKTLQQAYKIAGRPVGEPIVRTGFRGLGAGMRGASYLLTKGTTPIIQSQVAQKLAGASKYQMKKLLSPITSKMAKSQLPAYKDWRLLSVTSPRLGERNLKRIDNILSWARSYGKMPQQIEGVSETVSLFIKSRARKIDKLLEGIEKRAYRIAKEHEKRYNTGNTSRPYEKMLMDDAVAYLQGAKKLSGLEPELRPLVYELKKDIAKTLTEFGKTLPKGTKEPVLRDLKQALNGRLGDYFVRSFATFTNPKYTPDKGVRLAARDWILQNVVRKNRAMLEAAKNSHGKQFSTKIANEKYADDVIDTILETGKTGGANPIEVLRKIGTDKTMLGKKKFEFLKTGQELPMAIRRLLGQEKDLRSQVLMTVSNAIAATAKKKGSDMIAKIGLENGWLFKNPQQALTKFKAPKQLNKIPGMGSMKSDLQGLWTSPELNKILTDTRVPLDVLATVPVIRQLLQFKVLTQAGKTVYSPQTQVRNVTSASFFALWNGHVGRNANAIDSLRMMVKDVFKAGKGQSIDEVQFSKDVEKLVRLGVYDENVVASELRAVMKNIKEGKIKTEDDLFTVLSKSAPTEKATRLYAGGDNLWKKYGFEFFKSDLSRAFKSVDDVADFFKLHNRTFARKNIFSGETKSFDAALDEAAAFMLRNTYPTYSKVPPAIQGLRNIPLFGNFVSFPAEMLRTGALSSAMSLKHIFSNNPALREMGYRQLIGAYMAVKGIGTAAHAISNFVTGNSTEQWEAYKRSAAAPWDQNSNLIGIEPWKNGESAAINMSYFSPYDVLERPIQAALSMAHKKNIAPDQIEDYVLSLMFAADGPFMELMSPFLSPAIGYERIADVVGGNFLSGGRGGKTADGANIYSPSDNLSDKINKSFWHIAKGAEPGIISSGRKLKGAVRGDVSGAGKLMRLGDELRALFTGTRIIRIDVKNDLGWLTSETNRLLRAVDETEKFYTAKGYIDNPPSKMVDDFEKMQEEAFRIQRDLYMKIQDMKMLDLSDDDIEDILVKKGMNRRQASNLIDGEFTPIKYSVPRFETKVEKIEKVAKEKTKKSKNFIYNVNEGFIYPEDQLDNVIDKWEDRKFFPRKYNKGTGKWEGGYKPHLEGAVTNDKGNLVYDERGKIKKEKTFLQKVVPKIKQFILPGDPTGQRSQTPLPLTPSVSQQAVAQAPQQAGATGLTATETALLSNEEKAMRLRQRGVV